MTTTELIKLLQRNEFGGKSGKPREISLCINDNFYIPDSEFTLDGLTDLNGGVGERIFLTIRGEEFK